MNIFDPNECVNKEYALYVCNGLKEKIYVNMLDWLALYLKVGSGIN